MKKIIEEKKRVVIALSGGVDSSVAALMLKSSGYEVIAMYMKNWHDKSLTKNNECPWVQDSNDALQVAEQIGIPFHVIDLSKDYEKRIIEYMFNQYKNGLTPNPDVLCNKEIKFKIFLNYALKLNADYIATGHYCQKKETNGKIKLLQGKDVNKDQSYFLCQVSKKQLERVIFPIGHLEKSKVREIAKEHKLITHNKKDSQGLCFVGKIKLPVFLNSKIKKQKGKIIEINSKSKIYSTQKNEYEEPIYCENDGNLIGYHNGSFQYTIGQRKGIEIGGKPKPLFVIATNIKKNIVFVGMGDQHPGLFRKGLCINLNKSNWIDENNKIKNGESENFLVRIRHRQPLQKANIKVVENTIYIKFKEKQRGISKGQFAAWYLKNELIGSGPIN